MSKIEAGSVALSEDKFRIDGVLEEVSEIIRTDADSHKPVSYTHLQAYQVESREAK